MPTTTRHGFEKWSAGFSQSDVILNDLLDKLEVKLGLSVVSRTTDAQPGGPSAGDCYIITGAASGAAWTTFSQHDIAYFDGTTWYAYTPIAGWPAWVEDDTNGVMFNGTSWVVVSKDLPLDKFDATVDPTVNEDSGDGYAVGSRWINVTDDTAFVLLDATVGAAVWKRVDNVAGILDNFAATSDPTVDDDVDAGYSVGSRWINLTSDSVFTCADATDGAAVWVSASGLNQSQVDARVVAVAGDSLNGWSKRAAVNDDSVWVVSVGHIVNGNVIVTTNSAAAGDAGGVFMVRSNSPSNVVALIASANLDVSTGVLTGTTGTDGKLTVSVHTDNNIYIENRLGGARGVQITVNAAENLEP